MDLSVLQGDERLYVEKGAGKAGHFAHPSAVLDIVKAAYGKEDPGRLSKICQDPGRFLHREAGVPQAAGLQDKGALHKGSAQRIQENDPGVGISFLCHLRGDAGRLKGRA